MEEYKQNKELILQEKKMLEDRLSQYAPKSVSDMSALSSAMSKRIHGVYDILTDDSFSDEQKNVALKSIVSRIVYHREEEIADLYYYYS